MEFHWLQLILVAFGLFALVQLTYILGYFSRLAWYKPRQTAHAAVPVSVIIVAKNEKVNLTHHLPLFFNQSHPEFEVVVVNNASWDGTADLLKELLPLYPNLRVVTIEEQERYPKGKKFALTLGIKAAKYETLLFTDADCVPASPDWITGMQQAYTSKTEVVLGYGAYRKKGGLLNYFIRFETFYTALQYLSFALAGKPYMGVGRNLSYKKSTFFAVKGFASHNHIISGDDDLFVNEVAKPGNTEICIEPSVFTISEPKNTLGEWIKQKRRHLHTGKRYKGSNKFMLASLNLSHILFYGTGITLLAFFYLPAVVGIVFGVRLLAQHLVYFNAMKKLKENNLFYGILLLDILYPLYYLLIGLNTLFTRQKKGVW
ncbi:MAG TPA: glycosyltransferase [Bacteroidia bacterium]|nr:glycosyltransferase [Bacteroidia bacterium]